MAATETKLRQRDIRVGASTLHVLEGGDPRARAILFLHGWPQCAEAWTQIMGLAAAEYHAIAVDLPGIGGSTGNATDGSKSALAGLIEIAAETLELDEFVLVGHDTGGMIAYSFLRDFAPRAVVIMNVVIPGLDPWERVLSNPQIWHFALHAVEGLPERLVQGKQRSYFDYFFDLLAKNKDAISAESRDASVTAYASDESLRNGFNWYRAFARDAERNARATTPVTTPLLYLRGESDPGHIEEYVAGFRKAGVQNMAHGIIAGSGHFAPQEAPVASWEHIRTFVRGLG